MKRALENLRLSFQTQLSYLQTVEVTRHLRTLWFFLSLCLLLSARPASAAVTLLFEGGNAIISWPLTATGFILQQTENLGANAVWTPVSHSVAQTPDEYVVTVPATKLKQFFRLVPYSTGALSYHRIDIDNPNPQAGAGFGSTVAVIGDVNGDGVPDFAVGAPGQTVGGISGAGAVFVFSGADHAFIREIDNPAPALGGCFGAAISVFSGTNIVLGAPSQDRAYVVDPATGALVNSLAPSGLSPGNHFGFAVSGLFVTAPDASVNGQGESGALFYCKPNPTLVTNGGAFDRMGMAVAVGGFGYLVSEPAFYANGVHESGRVIGSLTLQAPIPEDTAFFGARIAALGNSEVVIGDHPFGPGKAFVFNRSGSFIRTLPSTGDFAGIGDVDGDSLPDLLMVNGTNGASVLSLSAEPPVELAKLDYPSTPRFACQNSIGSPGVTVTGLGDVDKDGVPDLLAGSPGLTVGTNQTQGRVFLFLSGKTPAQP